MADTSYRNPDIAQVSIPEVLRPLRSLLAVVAHPDDESFGLGGILSALAATGRAVSVLCFTAGEGSTLGASAELARTRAGELSVAAQILGVGEHWLEGLPDGGLAGLPERELSARIRVRVEQVDADALIVLDRSGVTGHPDHQAATAAALAAAAETGLPVLEWGVPAEVAEALATEFGVTMQALAGGEQVRFRVDRARHWEAIRAHVSQAPDNPLLRRRLELLGANETVRLVRPPLTSQLPRFVAHAGRWARPDADPAERSQLLDALVGFATLSDVTTWPATLLADDPQRAYAAHCLHNDANGWSLATIVTANGSATPPHDHQSWGAAATIAGAERNTRYSGVCPDRLRAVGQEVFPPGGGYLFGAGDIHQAVDAAGRSVSVHLLVGSGSHPIQRCPEPGTTT